MKILEWFGYVSKKEMDNMMNELKESLIKIQLIRQKEKKEYLKEIERAHREIIEYKYEINKYIKINAELKKNISEIENENYILRSNKFSNIRNDKIKAYILHYIYNKYRWSGHSPIEEVVNRCRSDKITRDKSEVRKNLEELINKGLLIRTKSRKKVDLNSNMKGEITTFIKKYLSIAIN